MKIINASCRISLVVVLSLALTGMAQAQGQGKGRLKAEFDEELTPLQSAINDIVTDREKKGKDRPKLTLKCNNPNSNNPRCSALDEDEPCLDCGELTNGNGKLIGRKNRTETIIDYTNPGQRKNGMVKFDRIKVGGRNSDGFGAGPQKSWKGIQRPIGRPDLDAISDRDAAAALGGYAGEMDLTQARMRQGRSGLADPINNDLDCIDTVTRQWAKEDGCFSDSGDLLTTMIELFEDDDNGNSVGVGCEHIATGQTFTESSEDGDEDICYDEFGFFKGTSLEELFDEDGPDFAQKIDQDGDGSFDEDPSESGDVITSCRMLYETEGLVFDETIDIVDDQCDMTRVFMVKFNRDIQANPKNTDKKLAYLVDDQGMPVDEETAKKPQYRNAKAYGEHPRRVKIREDFAIKCKGNEELIDGECVKALNNNDIAQLAYYKAMAAEAPGFDRNQKSPMLMGFTFAPPVIEWGYKIDEEACLDLGFGEVCAEVFFARIGYEFDIAAGLRLPIQVELTELPSRSAPGALAESMPVIRTSLEPKDFTVGEFKSICEDNNLSDNCTRFAFPEFLDSFNPFKTPDAVDGAEMVAKETIFAGIQVRVLSVPLINWAVDSDVDIMSMCTMLQIKGAVEGASLLDIAKIGVDLAQGQTTELLNALKENNCASFTTPFGFDEKGDLRTFPFTQGFDVRADCAEAFARGEVINVKGKPRPICTGLVLGAHGASLGVGLGVEASLGSTRIDANWKSNGDAVPLPGDRKLIYRHEPGNDAEVLDIRLEADNFQAGDFRDTATIELDDFVYYLNTINLSLSAKLQFGGILSPIPDIASFKLFDLVLTGDDIGIPIGQHSGMDPITAEFFVRNYALSVDGKPSNTDPAFVDIDTLLIKPGEAGNYQMRVNNRGSVEGNFDNFRVALSNQPDQDSQVPYTFIINPNTDLDCVDKDTGEQHFFGNPYDGIADDCYASGGAVRSDRVELIDEDGPGPEGALAAERDSDGDGLADEDPVENWQAAFLGSTVIEGVSAYTESNEFRTLEITPFRHPLTSPGRYPVQILADSVEAKANALSAVDPVNQSRTDAEDVVFILVDAFFDPLIAAQLKAESGKPGIGKAYTVEVSNGSNVEDTIDVDTNRVDSNQVGCTLTTLGDSDECPFRATPTAISTAWTNGALPTPAGPLQPLGVASNQFTVNVPTDWAGMEDTTYQVVFTVTSTEDPESPKASNNVLIEQTVIATMESMTRYIGLELLELIETLEQAEANGIATAGLKPISIHAVKGTNDRALDSILAGGLRKAASSHAANIRIMGGFTRALAGSGKKLPVELFDDLNARAAAIIADMRTAEANQIPSN